MRYIILAVTVFTLASPVRAVAQEFLWLKPGAKVRITAPALGMSERVGRLQVLNGDTLVVQVEARRQGRLQVGVLQVPMPAIAKLDVRTGRRGHWLEGAGIGFALGLALGAASGEGSSDSHVEIPTPLAAGISVGILGAIIGQSIKSDKWSEVPLDQLRPRLIAQQDGRVGLGVSLRF